MAVVGGKEVAHSHGQQPGSLEATLLALSDQVGGEYRPVAIQEADDALLVALETGVRRVEGGGGGQTLRAWSSARRAAVWSVLRLTSSWELV